MDEESSQVPNAEIQEDDTERGDHPACKLAPVSPTGPNIQNRDKRVTPAEELIPRPPYHRPQTEDPQERQKPHRHTAPEHVRLLDKSAVHLRLRLVQLSLDDGPSDGMQGCLREDYVPCPVVEEVEGLHGDTSQEREETLSLGEEGSEWCQGVGECSDSVAEAAETGARVVLVAAFYGSYPCLVDDSDESLDLMLARDEAGADES